MNRSKPQRWFTVAHGNGSVSYDNPALSQRDRESPDVDILWQVMETSRFRARRRYRELLKDPDLMDAWLKLGRVRQTR